MRFQEQVVVAGQEDHEPIQQNRKITPRRPVYPASGQRLVLRMGSQSKVKSEQKPVVADRGGRKLVDKHFYRTFAEQGLKTTDKPLQFYQNQELSEIQADATQSEDSVAFCFQDPKIAIHKKR